MDHVNSILTQFDTLSVENRRTLFHGILGQLRRPEWREVKQWAGQITFQLDILGKLPMELCLRIAEYLDLVDLFVLQRVSRQWHRILSSPSSQMVAIRSTMAMDLPKLTRNPDLDEIKAIVQKRLRAERGTPHWTHLIETPVFSLNETTSINNMADYSHDIFAYIRADDAPTSIAVLNVRSGTTVYLTTEEREHLIRIRVSKLLIAAVSRRGYCHVWDLRSQEHRSFRLSSLHYTHFVVNGLKVVFVYRTCAIHWGWDSGIARNIELKTYTVMVAPHPIEDQLTIARVGEEVYYGDRKVIVTKNCHMTVEQFAASGTDEFHCKRSQKQPFPLDDAGELPYPDDQELFDPIDAQEIYDGQSSILMATKGPSAHTWLGLWFSLENDTVITHRVTTHPEPISQVRCVGQGLLYAPLEMGELLILDSIYTTPASSAEARECWHANIRRIPKVQALWVFGDSDYGIFMSEQTSDIWCFSKPLQHSSEGVPGANLGDLLLYR